jgi:hypothetical protein
VNNIVISQTFVNPHMVLEQAAMLVRCAAAGIEDGDYYQAQHSTLLLALSYLHRLNEIMATDSVEPMEAVEMSG